MVSSILEGVAPPSIRCAKQERSNATDIFATAADNYQMNSQLTRVIKEMESALKEQDMQSRHPGGDGV